MFSVRSLLAYARARRSVTEMAALWAAPIFIFSGCGAGAAGGRRFERSELGGLRRQQRIATTWTWRSVVFSLQFFEPSLSLDLGVGRPPGGRGASPPYRAV